jgi:hypothetical protein
MQLENLYIEQSPDSPREDLERRRAWLPRAARTEPKLDLKQTSPAFMHLALS